MVGFIKSNIWNTKSFTASGCATVALAIVFLHVFPSIALASPTLISATECFSSPEHYLLPVIIVVFLYVILFTILTITSSDQILSEPLYQGLLESAPDSIIFIDSEGSIVLVNKATEKLFGYERIDLLNQKVEMLLPERFREKHTKHRDEFFKAPRPRPMGIGLELYGLRKDNHEFPVEISLSPLKTEYGILVSAAVRDITLRKIEEEKLRNTSESLNIINRIVAACTSTLHLTKVLEIALDSALELVGLEGGTICLLNPDNTFKLEVHRGISKATEEDLSSHTVRIGDCLCGNVAMDRKPLILWDYDEVMQYASREAQRGENLQFHAAFPIAIQDKKLGVLCVFTRSDAKPHPERLKLLETMTAQVSLAIDNAILYEEAQQNAIALEKRVAERTSELEKINVALSESEEKFRQIAENIKEVFWISASDGSDIYYVNSAFEEIWGLKSSELYKNAYLWIEAILPEYQKMVEESFQQENLVKGGFNVEYQIKRPDGSTKWIHDRGFPILNNEQKIQRIVGIASDISKFKEIDRLKSMFIASMSHELRTPLNSIIGFIGIILQGMAGDVNEEQKDMLSRSYRAAKHLLALITDVIDISKIEAGKITSYTEDILLDEVVQEAVSTLAPDIKQKGLEVSADIPFGLMIKSDRKRLLQCVLNYLNNAVKYTEKGNIHINGTEKGHMVEISVKDTGIGIAPEDMSRLFDSFVRLESPLMVKNPGTGLGLYLTKKLVGEVLHGTVDVESTPGSGSTFSMLIPNEI